MKQRHVKKLLKKKLCPACKQPYSIKLIGGYCAYLRCGRNYSDAEFNYLIAQNKTGGEV